MKNKNYKNEEGWVDVHDSELMIALGIHPPYMNERDPNVWCKSNYERKILKSLRRSSPSLRCSSIPKKSIPVRAKLIIRLVKNDIYPNTTYSTECWMHEIGDIIQNYFRTTKVGLKECLIDTYSYNGKTYRPHERPFWP